MEGEDESSTTHKKRKMSHDRGEVLSAKELGVEEGEKYERLLQIFKGDDITPEDYELLSQLDNKNKKRTLSQECVDKIPILVIGGDGAGAGAGAGKKEGEEESQVAVKEGESRVLSREEIGGGDHGDGGKEGSSSSLSSRRCEICMEKWGDLKDGTELRRLPCGHTFCKECIDHWLKEVSNKCPNLSCFWCQD